MTWRVYKPEWVIVYTSERLEVDGRTQCRDRFTEDYEGRVRDGDWRIKGVGSFRPQHQVLELKLPNMAGECKAKELAEALQVGQGGVLVEGGSPEERELLSYGSRRLPK